MKTVLVLRGEGRYSDPWHDFAATSSRIAKIAEQSGARVRISGDVESELSRLDDVDLLVFDVGNPTRHGLESSTFGAARAGFVDYVRSGRPVWSHHVSATSFPHMPEWEEVVGGRWVAGTSMHPEIGEAFVEVPPSDHPITRGLQDFTVWDERYTSLRVSPNVQALAFHEHAGEMHPLLWAHEYGATRVVYDALGHDETSFDSPVRSEILRRSLAWLTENQD
ncbi:hypothetical protein AKG07_09945 [Microbacterium sp. CGR1]|uniref:ThuA domain-containing protein n=1 Tax=Microbacterium sp. CGR1 TaxID=1696072 RepID=UPI00069E186F|nr:ThuA domain-containing protein [Microbacterium sp. CGR1]AKV86561.1 hypothetical protein AKG07_09945 [Microbacterium sp. CGR1]